MFRRMPRAQWLAVALLLYFLYFFRLTGAGMLGPDEPRYASIGRAMASSGDWITPRLWGEPWFEKPALLYWLTGAAFRAGLPDDLAPRLPVAILGAVFLLFFYWTLRREFGSRAACFATVILGTSAGWLGLSYVAVTDMPLAATFSAAMLLCLPWIQKGDPRRLPAAAALLALAVLAKGLVPLVLAAPLLWCGRRRLTDLLKPRVAGAFALVAMPWYVLCYARNGFVFLQKFFWQHQFERFASDALQHVQPFWFYAPVLLAALFPWTPVLALLARRSLYSDARRRFLLALLGFGFLFFSASTNKLPGYLLPLVPAAAALLGLALDEAREARPVLAGCALLLLLMPALTAVLPQALAVGLSRAHFPPFAWTWLVPALLAIAVWRLGRGAAVAVLVLGVSAGVVFLKVEALPAIDRAVSARPLWREIAPRRDQVCVTEMHRNWLYGLNYYSVTPLPDCSWQPKPLRIGQAPGRPPVLLQPGVEIPNAAPD
ncbi:MAG: glycosyltransferase family 39 protein [Acidobacteria bacterium]|nr:glycosyltransferase family 39 protein [Acidobacteriota bacterium]